MTVIEMVYDVHDTLRRHRIDHAFGGALALAYYADPRGTLDVDVNVFAQFSGAGDVVARLAELDLAAELPSDEWSPIAGVRLRRKHDRTKLDLFFSLDEHYEEVAQRTRSFAFGPDRRRIPFLSREDLAVFKLSFGRDKDWVDLRALTQSDPSIDLDYIERQLVGMRGPTMYPRIARLRHIVRES